MSGDWLALGATAALAVAGSVRRGAANQLSVPELPELSDQTARLIALDQRASLARNYRPTHRVANYLDNHLRPHLTRRYKHLPRVSIAGTRFPDLQHKWVAQVDGHTRALSFTMQHRYGNIDVYASPGWDGSWKVLDLQVTDYDCIEAYGDIELPLEPYPFTGDLERDGKTYIELLTPLFQAIERAAIEPYEDERCAQILHEISKVEGIDWTSGVY